MHIPNNFKDFSYGLYKITNLATNESYIGFSSDPKKRIMEHFNGKSPRGSILLKTAILTLGSEPFIAAVIEGANSLEDAKRKKEELIDKFNTMMPLGYNLPEGQTSRTQSLRRGRKGKLTEKQVISIINDKRPHPIIGKEYGLERSTICRIKGGHLYSYFSSESYTVYKFSNTINRKSFVGVTNNLERRIANHIKLDGLCPAFHAAVKKYGWSNFHFEIIESNLSLKQAHKKEIHYIKELNSFAPHGYNLTEGGDGLKGLKGEKNSNNKITANQAQAIINDPRNHKTVADEYGLHIVTVHDIRKGKTWKNLDRSKAPVYATGNKLTDDATAQKVIDDPCSNKEASEKYGVSTITVSEIRTGRRFKHLDRSNTPKYKTNKLDDSVAQAIINDPCCNADAAKKYGSNPVQIHEIRSGKRFKHLDRSKAPIYENMQFKRGGKRKANPL